MTEAEWLGGDLKKMLKHLHRRGSFPDPAPALLTVDGYSRWWARLSETGHHGDAGRLAE